MIHVVYDAVDGAHKEGRFKTLRGAQDFAWKWVGHTPDVSTSSSYAVSFDGVGRVMWSGVLVEDLFPSVFRR